MLTRCKNNEAGVHRSGDGAGVVAEIGFNVEQRNGRSSTAHNALFVVLGAQHLNLPSPLLYRHCMAFLAHVCNGGSRILEWGPVGDTGRHRFCSHTLRRASLAHFLHIGSGIKV